MLRLDSEVQYVKGVGPRRVGAAEFARRPHCRVISPPHSQGLQDRATFVPSRFLRAGQDAQFTPRSIAAGPSRRILAAASSMSSSRTEPASPTPSGFTAATSANPWFTAGRQIVLYGRVDATTANRNSSFFNPEFELLDETRDATRSSLDVGRIVPIYEEIGGHDQPSTAAHYSAAALADLAEPFDDPIPETFASEHGFPDLRTCLQRIHFPIAGDDIEDTEPSRFSLPPPIDLRRVLSARTRVRPAARSNRNLTRACVSKPAMRIRSSVKGFCHSIRQLRRSAS